MLLVEDYILANKEHRGVLRCTELLSNLVKVFLVTPAYRTLLIEPSNPSEKGRHLDVVEILFRIQPNFETSHLFKLIDHFYRKRSNF